jgi:Amidohydrolase family
LIPGLVDMHVHLFNRSRPPNTWAFPLFVANGVTSVREMSARPESLSLVKGWRAAAARGELLAPRVVAAGVAVHVRSSDDVARQIALAADGGADFIKIFSDVSFSSWQNIISAAGARSLPVVGHVPASVSLLAAAAGGQQGNEHLMQAFEACTPIEQELLSSREALEEDALVACRDAQEARVLGAFDQATCDRVAAALAATGQIQTPTLILALLEARSEARSGDLSPSSDPRWPTLRPDEQARWLRILGSITPEERAVAAQRWPVARRITSTFARAGVPILAGTDAPMPRVYPGFSLHEELEALVMARLSPAAALRAATLTPAAVLGLSEVAGSVTVGKRADLVLLDADPLRDIRNTQRIHAVILDGRVLTRSALDALIVTPLRSDPP